MDCMLFIEIKSTARFYKIIPGQNLPSPGHGTLWANSGTVQTNPGRLATLVSGRTLVYEITRHVSLY